MLAQKGKNVHLVCEEDSPHPVRFLSDLKQPLHPWQDIGPEEFSAGCLQKFSNFCHIATGHDGRDATILDGLFFHTDTTTLFLMDPGLQLVENHIRKLFDIAAQNPLLCIILHQNSPQSHLQQTFKSRPHEWGNNQRDWKLSSPFCRKRNLSGIPGYLEFYHEYELFIRSCVASMIPADIHCLQIMNPSEDWRRARMSIWDGIVRDMLKPPFSAADLF